MQIFKAIFLPVIGISIIIFIVYLWAWKQPKYFTEVEETSFVGDSPAGFNPADVKNKLVVFGTPIASNSNDNEIRQLENKWESEKPDLLLIEGKAGFLLPGLMDPVKKFGIVGKARELALKNNVDIYSFDLPEEKIIEKLLKKYPSEQIALSFILDAYFRNSKCAKNIPREYILRDCIYNHRFTGLNAGINSAQDIDKIWERDFRDLKSWRDSNYLPGYTGEIEQEIVTIKQKHYYNLISHFLKQNKKVFVVGNPGPAAIAVANK